MKHFLFVLLAGIGFTSCQERSCIGELELAADYAGVYVDEDGTDNNLVITPDSTGGYHVSIGIFRLTLLDDGHGESTADGLAFTTTDAAGQPIGGIITLSGDTAIVTFTDSHWQYLPNGEQVRYFKNK